jgi:hypothetical protein
LNKSKQWLLNSFWNEIQEIQRFEGIISRCAVRDYEVRRALLISEPLEKCKVLLTLALDRLGIESPHLGTISFENTSVWENGLLLQGFDNPLLTKMMCIFLIYDRNMVHNCQWKHSSVETEFHIFLHCYTIFRQLSTPEDTLVTVKDCKWPVLKELEASHGFRANCRHRGYVSDNCQFKMCLRCGRKGHLKKDYFARRDVLSQYLETCRK